jgi:dynein heavy chain
MCFGIDSLKTSGDLQNKEKDNHLQVMKLSDADFSRKLEMCITYGYPLLIENVGEELDSTLDPLLVRAVFKSAGQLQIRLGDNNVMYSERFKLYITTKLRNPHYAPEVRK